MPPNVAITAAAEIAEEAFWDSVAKQFPECVGGEMDPLILVILRAAMRDAVAAWYAANRPEDTPE